MNRRLTYYGAAGIVLSILLPVLFYLITLIPWDIIEAVYQGIDWFCCFSVSGTVFLLGLGVLVVGLRTD